MPSHIADEVKARIQVLFFQVGLEDHDMLTVLRDEGFKIGKYTLIRLRFELGLKRRVRGVEAIQEADRLVRRLVTEELQKGVIDGYGRRYLATHFRQNGHIVARYFLPLYYCKHANWIPKGPAISSILYTES